MQRKLAGIDPAGEKHWGHVTGMTTNLIYFSFWLSVEKSLKWHGIRKSTNPHRGEHCSLSLLPVASFSQSRTLEGLFFSLNSTLQRPWFALASCIASGTNKMQGHHQVGSTNTIENKWGKPWLCVCKNTLFYSDPWLQKANRIALSEWPDLPCLSERGKTWFSSMMRKQLTPRDRWHG